MTKEQKTVIGICFIVIILLILWLRGNGSSTSNTTIEQGGSTNVSIGGMGDISIPSLNLPPRNGPIIWPSFDNGGSLGALPNSQYLDGVAGHSTCACGDGTTSTYLERPAPDPVAPPSVVKQLVAVTRKAVSSMSVGFSSPSSQNGYVNAAGNTTSGVWW